jgi:hypothetical protein
MVKRSLFSAGSINSLSICSMSGFFGIVLKTDMFYLIYLLFFKALKAPSTTVKYL